jgi:thioredoxin reductase (NADPH)
MHFSQYARRVVMLVRGSSLASSMSQYLINQLKATPNIQIEYNTNVIEAHGEDRLEAITIQCLATNEISKVPANSLFIMIGAAPNTDWLADVVERDELGFIYSGPQLTRDGKRPNGWKLDRDPGLLETNVPGIFVVGDVRHGSVKRVASGVGEGSVAISFVHQYLSKVV